MGNQRGSDGCGVNGGSDSCNPCKTDSGEGLVQREALEGLERYIIADRNVCKGGKTSSDSPSVEEGDDSMVASPN